MKQRQWLRNEICIQRAWPRRAELRAGLSRVVPAVPVLPVGKGCPCPLGTANLAPEPSEGHVGWVGSSTWVALSLIHI